ncbi:hypothetical protein TrCOL_g5413 [Triparma columacea]|uniref:Uncharacterized protein n=1 Tax=Triparma columacea TaxID=722753 RepID=A0A9W7L9L9_9STRA|nr:hypothetical protein TrCOL_g5413 [Triparma columacea]
MSVSSTSDTSVLSFTSPATTAPMKDEQKVHTYPTSSECTSLKITPSGNFMLAGFADGTLRLFDLNYSSNKKGAGAAGEYPHAGSGEIMAHIQAKGLHTNLIMSLGITEDGRFCFGGVLRGSVEMVCVDLSNVEEFYKNSGKKKLGNLSSLVRIFKHQDAKLKGFGSVTRLSDGLDTSDSSYRLFCGKGIKNIHIWSFKPPTAANPDPIWECIYDTQSNGMTVEYLAFRRGKGGLQGVSKSQGQCIRLWDLSGEEKHEPRPESKRPSFVDVPNTENAVGVFGSYAFAGGHGVRVVDLDNDSPPFMTNDMEIPPPSASKSAGTSGGSSRRRAMRTVVTASGISDGSRVLFELSDGNVLYYSDELAVQQSSPLCNLPAEWSMEKSDDRYVTNKITVNKIGANGIMVVITTHFNGRSGYGEINTKILSDFDDTIAVSKPPPAATPSSPISNLFVEDRKNNWGWMGVVPFAVNEKPLLEDESDEEKPPATPKKNTKAPKSTSKSTGKKRQSSANHAEGGKRGRADQTTDSVLSTSPSKLEAQINREVAEALAELRRRPQLTVVEPAGLYNFPKPKVSTGHLHAHSSAPHCHTTASKKHKNLTFIPPTTNFESRFPNPPLPLSPSLDAIHRSQRTQLLQSFHASYEIFMSNLASATARMKATRSLSASGVQYTTGAGLITRTSAPQESGGSHHAMGGTRQATATTMDSTPPTFQALQDIVEIRTARNMKIDEAITAQQEVLADLLARQRMESQVLAAKQGKEKGEKVEMVAVDFPFQDCFVQAKKDMTG